MNSFYPFQFYMFFNDGFDLFSLMVCFLIAVYWVAIAFASPGMKVWGGKSLAFILIGWIISVAVVLIPAFYRTFIGFGGLYTAFLVTGIMNGVLHTLLALFFLASGLVLLMSLGRANKFRNWEHPTALSPQQRKVLLLLVVDSLAMIGLAVMNFLYVTNLPGGFYNSTAGMLVAVWLVLFFESVISTSQVLVFFPLPPRSSSATPSPTTGHATDPAIWKLAQSTVVDSNHHTDQSLRGVVGDVSRVVQAQLCSNGHTHSPLGSHSQESARCD